VAKFPKIEELKQFEVVFWDLDNTIYPYDPAHKVAWEITLKLFAKKFNLDIETSRANYAVARNEINNRLHGQAASHSRLLYFKEMIQNIGKVEQISSALMFEKTYWNSFLKQMQINKNALKIIEVLYANGIPQVIITDLTTQIQLKKLKQLKIAKYFKWMLTSEEAGIEKPNPKIFEMALVKMNVKSEKCCFIGDNIKTDGGAARVGIKTYII